MINVRVGCDPIGTAIPANNVQELAIVEIKKTLGYRVSAVRNESKGKNSMEREAGSNYGGTH